MTTWSDFGQVTFVVLPTWLRSPGSQVHCMFGSSTSPTASECGLSRSLYYVLLHFFFFFSSTFAPTNSYEKPNVDGVKWRAKNKTKCTLITHKRTEDTGVLFRCHWSDQAEPRQTGEQSVEGMYVVTLSSFFVMEEVQINKHASVLYSFSLYLACEIETSIFDVLSQRPVPAVLLYKSSASDTLFHEGLENRSLWMSVLRWEWIFCKEHVQQWLGG